MDVDRLEFELIINDAGFDKKVGDILTKAKNLNAQLSKLLTAQATGSIITPDELKRMQDLNVAMKEQRSLESKLNTQRKRRIELEEKITSELQKQSQMKVPQTVTFNDNRATVINRMGEAQASFNKEVSRSSRLWTELKNITTAYFSIMGAERLVSNMIRISAEFEKQRVSLEAILRDINGADKIFEQIKSLAVVSPFTFKELVSYTKQLSAFSVPMGELYDTTKMLADVSAGLGVGMDRLILAYGQIRSASFLRGQEVRQLTEAAVPILTELSKMLTAIEGKYVSVGEVFDKISARQVTFEMVEQIFRDMTSEGGKFYQMQEVLAQTLSGKLSNLTDAYQIMFAEIGEKTNGAVVSAVDALRSLAENYEKVGKIIVELTATYGAYKVMLTSVKVAQQAALEAQLAKAIVGTGGISSVKALGAAMSVLVKNTKAYQLATKALTKVNPYVALAAGAAALGFALYKVITYESDLERLHKTLADVTERSAAAVSDENDQLDYLFGRLERATDSTEEYNKVKKEIMSKYGQYLSDVGRENLEVKNLADAYRGLSQAITESNQTKYLEEGRAAIKDYYDEILKGRMKALDANLEAMKLSTIGSVAQQLKAYLRGEIERTDFTKEAQQAYAKMVYSAQEASYTLFGHSFSDPERLKKDIADAKKVVLTETKDLMDGLDFVYTATKGETETIVKDWQRKIGEIIDDAQSKDGITLNLKFRELSLDSIIEEVGKQIESLNKEIDNNDGIQDDIAGKLRKQLAYWQRINNEVLKGKATPGTKGSTAQKDPRIKVIEDEIEAYKTLKSVYEDFSQYTSSAGAKEAVKGIFGRIFGDKTEKDYEAEIMRLATELRGMGDEGQHAAEKIFSTLAIEEARGKVAELRKQVEDYAAVQKRINGYLEESKSVEQKIRDLEQQREADLLTAGLTAEQQSAITEHYNNEIDKLKESLLELTQISLTEFWQSLTGNNASASYRYLTDLQKKAIELQNTLKAISPDKNSKGKITGYTITKDSYPDVLDALGFDGDKLTLTVSQVNELVKAIDSLYKERADKNGFATMMETIAGKNGVGLNQFLKAMKEGGAEGKNYRDMMSAAMKDVSTIGNIFSELGQASDNQFLTSLGDTFSSVGEVIGKLTEGDILGSVKAVVSSLTSWITASVKLRNNIAAAAKEAEKLQVELQLKEGVSTVFGTNDLKNIENAVAVLEKYGKETRANLNDAFGKSINWKSGLFNWGTSSKSLKDAVSELGYDLVDEYGNLNADALQAILDTYENLTTADRKWIESAIQNAELYKEAIEQMKDAVADIYEDTLDSVADSLVDSWVAAGNAALDYTDILDDVARAYAKLVLKNALVKSVFTPELEAKVQELTAEGKYTDAVDVLQQALEKVNALAPEWAAILNGFDDYFASSESSEDTIASGITSITEDTANLLASYVNAIRADVAGTRLVAEGISTDVKAILGLLPNAPTLAEYLTKIEANTFNNALHTSDILADLRSMMTNERGDTALRVYM